MKFMEKPFIRNVMIMVSGSFGGQLITLGLAPFITRMYGPEAYGLMGVFITFCFLIIPVAALTYPGAIILARNNDEANGVARISLFASVGTAIFVAVLLLFFSGDIARLLQLESLLPLFYLIPFVILFSGYLQIMEQWMIRQEQFGRTAGVEIVQATALQGSRLGIGFFLPTSSVLIFSWTLGLAFKASLLNFFSRHPLENRISFKLDKNVRMKKLVKKYQDFPIYRAPQLLLYTLAESLPVLLLASFFGPVAAGFYSIGRTVLNVPTNLISKSIGDVFYQRFTVAAQKGEDLPALLVKASMMLAAVGIFPFGIVMLFGPALFSFVFGTEWVVAGEYARWIALWLFFMLMARPCTVSLPVLSAQRFHLIYTVFMIAVWGAGLSIGAFVFQDELITIAIFGVAGALLNIVLMLICIGMSKRITPF